MSDESETEEIITRFGKAIADLHERSITAVSWDLESIRSPQSERDHAIAAYFNAMDQDQKIVALAKSAVEHVLHDLFFMFDEHPEFKLMLQNEAGDLIDLVQAVDVIQAFPLDWIENASGAGFETGKITAFLDQKLNLNETRQERRARILAEKDKDKSAT